MGSGGRDGGSVRTDGGLPEKNAETRRGNRGWLGEQGRESPGRGNGPCEALRRDVAGGVVEELKGGRRPRRPDSTSAMRALAQSLGFTPTGSFKARERFAQTGEPQGCNAWFFHTVAS